MSTNSRFSDLSEKSASVEASISQRLKWASGANPQLSSVATAFEQALAHRTAVLEVTILYTHYYWPASLVKPVYICIQYLVVFQTDSRIVKDLSTICNSILHLETMRSKSAEASAVVVKSTQIVTRYALPPLLSSPRLAYPHLLLSSPRPASPRTDILMYHWTVPAILSLTQVSWCVLVAGK